MLSITSIVSVGLLSGTVDEASSVSVRCYSRLPRKILFTNSPYVIMTSSTQTAKESCVSYDIISSLLRICTSFALHRCTCGAASGSNDDLFAASSTGGTDRRPCAGAEGAGHTRHARVPAARREGTGRACDARIGSRGGVVASGAWSASDRTRRVLEGACIAEGTLNAAIYARERPCGAV